MHKSSPRRQTLLDSSGSGLIPTYIYFFATSETVKIYPTFDLHFLCVSSFFPADSECLKTSLSVYVLWFSPFYCKIILITFLQRSHFSHLSQLLLDPLWTLIVSGWKTFPGFITSFLRPKGILRSPTWELCKARQRKADRSSCHGAVSWPDKLSLDDMSVLLDIVLAWSICQVKHDHDLNSWFKLLHEQGEV